jgi:NADPH-dependent curcumin reductase
MKVYHCPNARLIMTPNLNTTVRLARRPTGLPDASTWTIADEPVQAPADGEIQVRIDFISLDPAMRGWLNDSKSYIPPVAINDVMRAGAVGEVLTSSNPAYSAGDFVYGMMGVQSLYTGTTKGLTKVDPHAAPLQSYLGGLGMPGMTAYFGLHNVGVYKDGETVVVSGAAGAVGSVVGQIARIKGSRVIGIAGGPDKCRAVVENFGFDACIDYKSENVAKRLRELCPKGIDVYFDNVGGEILEAAIANIALRGRIVICGAISSYNDMTGMKGPRNYLNLLVMRGRMEGMVVFDYANEYAQAQAQILHWMQAGQLKLTEDVRTGLRHFPDVLNLLFSGGNTGKLVLKP